MRFIDTVTLFAAFFPDEKRHLAAKKIVETITEGKVKNVVYSDYVLDELLTLARTKKNATASNKIVDELIDSEIKLVKIEQKHLAVAFEIFKKYEKLSFTDSTTVALMLDYGIKEIYSFDSGFDGVPKLIRIEDA